MPVLAAVDTPRPSCVVAVDGDGKVVQITTAAADDAIVHAVPGSAAVIAVDAPLSVPNRAGSRPVDQLLAWLDISAFPVSGERLEKVYGGARGPRVLEGLRHAGRRVVETAPDAVLRELAWEAAHPLGTEAQDLAEYRERWPGFRTARYRPKGTGRAVPAGLVPAWTLLSGALDLGGWTPDPKPDDWAAIADAAVLDAVAAAYAAWRVITAPRDSLVIGDDESPLVIPADANLRNRALGHGRRLGVRVTDGIGWSSGPPSDGDGD
jgi:predicted nuclease with RNAse H fold